MSKTIFFLKWTVIWVSFTVVSHLVSAPITLANLEYSNPSLKNLRSEIKENLRISKSGSKRNKKWMKNVLIPSL